MARERIHPVSKPFAAQKSYDTRMKAKGFRRLSVWVPEDRLDELADKAADMRNQAK